MSNIVQYSDAALLKNTPTKEENPQAVGELQGRKIYRHPNYTPKQPLEFVKPHENSNCDQEIYRHPNYTPKQSLGFIKPHDNSNCDQEKILTSAIQNQKKIPTLLRLFEMRGFEFNHIHWAQFFKSLQMLEKGCKGKWAKIAIERLKELLEKKFQNQELPPSSIVQILYFLRSGKFAIPNFIENLCNQLANSKLYLRDQEQYMLCTAIRELNIERSLALQIIDSMKYQWFDRNHQPSEAVKNYKPQALAGIYRTLAYFFPNSSKTIQFFETCLRESIDSLSIEQCVDSLLAQSSLKYKNLEFVEALHARGISLIKSNEGYIFVMSAASIVGYCDEEWCESVCEKILKEELHFQTYEKLIILQSITRLGIDSDSVKNLALLILDAPDFESMYLEDKTMFLLSFSFLFGKEYADRIHPKIEALCAFLEDRVQMDSSDNQKKVMLFQSMVLSGYDQEKTEKYLAKLEPQEPETSFLQIQAQEILMQRLKKKDLIFKLEQPLLHTFVDISIEGVKIQGKDLIVQVDGVCHFSVNEPKKESMSTLINTRILELNGYYVYRIRSTHFNQDIDALVALIDHAEA